MNHYRVLIALIGVLPICGFSQDISCGILKERGDGYVVSKQTLSIPLTLKRDDPDFAFGCVIDDDDPFSVHYKLEFPEPEVLNVNEPSARAEKGERVSIESPPTIYSGKAYVALRFDEGDKRGYYDVKVYINDNISKNISFHVQ